MMIMKKTMTWVGSLCSALRLKGQLNCSLEANLGIYDVMA